MQIEPSNTAVLNAHEKLGQRKHCERLKSYATQRKGAHLGVEHDPVLDLPAVEVGRIHEALRELVHASCELSKSQDYLAIDGVWISFSIRSLCTVGERQNR